MTLTASNPILSGAYGVHCNTGDDLSFKTVYGTPCIGGEAFTVDTDEAKVLNPSLNVTANSTARKAEIIIEKDPGQPEGQICARFKMCGDAPTANSGFPLYNNGQICVMTIQNLANFSIIGIGAGFNHTVRVMYFS